MVLKTLLWLWAYANIRSIKDEKKVAGRLTGASELHYKTTDCKNLPHVCFFFNSGLNFFLIIFFILFSTLFILLLLSSGVNAQL